MKPAHAPKDPNALTKQDLLTIVRFVQELLFLEDKDDGNAFWTLEKYVDLSDFVTEVGEILGKYNLLPRAVGPKDWNPREKP